ncbi:MAG: hypothetical protein Q8936_06560 [Bacillota bacterium]|nr:hypothetical protein [Bacillota bacterium]
MKHGKRPKLKQKVRIEQLGLDAELWLVVKNTTEDFHIFNPSIGELREYKIGEDGDATLKKTKRVDKKARISR